MKIYRFSIFLVFITTVALLYVHQQVHLLKISYRINSSEKELSRLLDQNSALVYNVTQLKSPVYLDKKFLATKKDFAISRQWQIVEIEIPREEKRPTAMAKLERKSTGLFKIFGKPRDALANTVK